MKNIHINNDDNYATPPKLYEELNKRFNFDFDPCPYNEKEIVNDGLKIEWGNSNFVNFFWDNDIFCNFVEWKKLNALVVEKKNQQINLQSVQIERGDSSLVVRDVNLRKVEKELKTIDSQSISSQKNIDYYPLVLQDVQNARLSDHLIKLILLLNQDVNQDLVHIVGLANVNTQKKLWQENVTILKQKILLRIQKLNIENLIKEEKDIEKEMLSEIIYIEEILLSGLMNNGKDVNYILETSVRIVSPKNFLLKTILSLYQTILVLEQSKKTLYQPVLNVTVQKDLNTQKIGVTLNQLQESPNTSKLSIKLNHKARCFVNPPYSQKLKEEFVKRGVEEMKKGKVCVFLIPVSTSTKLFHEWIKPNATEIDFLKGRIKFGKLDENGNFYIPLNKKGKEQSGTKDSMIVVLDGRSQACR